MDSTKEIKTGSSIKIFVNGFAFLVNESTISIEELCKLVSVPRHNAIVYRGESDEPESPLATSFKIENGDRFSLMRQYVQMKRLR